MSLASFLTVRHWAEAGIVHTRSAVITGANSQGGIVCVCFRLGENALGRRGEHPEAIPRPFNTFSCSENQMIPPSYPKCPGAGPILIVSGQLRQYPYTEPQQR